MPDGGATLFRADANARRFAESAQRMAMPPLPEELFLASIRELVSTDRDWIPEGEGASLYLRPFMFASETFLGVRPAQEYLYLVIASPAGAYFKGGAPSVTLWVSEHYTRAAPGGTGAAKCGGNYAASLVAQAEAIGHECDQVVFLDAAENRYVEELGGMNVFFVFEDGSIQTPPLTGTILPGITRESLLTLARDAGITVREERYSLEEWQADAASGRLREAFACGTAAVVTPIGRVRGRGFDFSIGNGGPGMLTEQLRAQLVAIQRGTAPDPHGWVERLF
jgi:branched-chain amino acid aminotransferase